MQEYKRNRHSVYRLTYHLVVVTKYRKPCLSEKILNRLKEISQTLFQTWRCEIIEINGESDHLHILFEANPTTELSKLINNFKTVSSRYIRKEFQEDLAKFYWKTPFWSPSYFITTTGGANIETIKKYIQEQGEK